MYQAFIFLTFLAYCSSAPYNVGLNVHKSAIIKRSDKTDVADTLGSGYAHFERQRNDDGTSGKAPAPQLSEDDLSAYMLASAFSQDKTRTDDKNDDRQQEFPFRSNLPKQNYRNPDESDEGERQGFPSNDLSEVRLRIPDGYGASQPKSLPKNLFRNQQNLRLMGSQQFPRSPSNMNAQQMMLNGYGNQQQDHSFLSQPQPMWNNQPKSAGFNPQYPSPRQMLSRGNW